MKSLHLVIASALLATAALPSGAKDKPGADGAVVMQSAPGKASIAEEARVTAIVQAIDLPQRLVTLKGPKGTVFTMVVGPVYATSGRPRSETR